LKKGQRVEDVPITTMEECGQLVKANSIEGCKKNNVTVIYTRWKNLHKTSDMQVGAIGFHNPSNVKRMNVIKNNTIINKISKTKEELSPDLAELQLARSREYIQDQKKERKEVMVTEKKLKFERDEAARLRSYE
jgi:hypothetical protein